MSEKETDGLGDFDLDQVGMQGGAFGGARIVKFDADRYITREGEVIGPERELIVLGLKKIVQKFVNKQLLDTIPVPDGERVPDIKAMNESAPRTEWGPGLDGQPQGPYTLVLVLKLLDAATMDRFAFITKSKGGSIAVGDLSDKTKIIRKLRGPDISPVVSLNSTIFRIARLNITRKRPDFRVVRWIKLGGDDGGDRKLPVPETPLKPLSAPTAVIPAPAPVAQAQRPSPVGGTPAFFASTIAPGAAVTVGTPVREPTLAEEIGDELPW